MEEIELMIPLCAVLFSRFDLECRKRKVCYGLVDISDRFLKLFYCKLPLREWRKVRGVGNR